MADDRDRTRRRTPPAGVRAQTAPPVEREWDDHHTPPPETVPEAIAQVRRRQKITQQTTQTTLDRVGELRTELGARISNLDSRVDGLSDASARMTGTIDGMDGKVDLLTDLVKTSLEAQSEIRVAKVTAAVEVTKTADAAAVEVKKTAAIAAVEVRKTAEIAVIDEANDRRAARRQLAIRVVAVAGPPIAAAIALLVSHC